MGSERDCRWRVAVPRAVAGLLFLLSAAALACDDEDDDGLDVALVLSGGGALATTHVGALTVIEELGVPIHCVVGTSMGSVVGALYVVGYDAEALRAVFRDSRWPEAFAGRIPRRDQPYLRKEQDDLYFSGYVAGFDTNGLRLPAGFRNMSGLQALYRDLLIRIPANQDFDDLPLPYRAVATDLATGESVALASGDLVEAMLASMAVPGVFPPRRVDGYTLVDGGLSEQLPVATAQALGADLIIALDTTVEPPPPDAAWSVGQVTQQLIRLRVWHNWGESRSRLGARDVLLRPDLDGLTTSSFERAEQGFASGEAAARAETQALLEIKRLAAPRLRAAPPRALPEPDKLVVDNSSVISDVLIERRFDYRPDAFEDLARTNRRLRNLAAFGPFGEVDLAVVDADTARLTTRPLNLGRNLLDAGVRASNDFDGESTYAVLGRYSRRPLTRNGAELRVQGELGTDLGLAMELYQPFGPESRFFVSPTLAYRAEEFLFDFQGARIGNFWQQYGEAELALGRELGDWGIFELQGAVRSVETETQVAVFPVPSTTDTYAGGGAFFGIDTLDHADWPRLGIQLRAQTRWLEQIDGDGGDSQRYWISAVKPFGVGPLDVTLRARRYVVENDEDNPTDVLRVGGFRRLSAFPENSLLADRYTLASVELAKRLTAADRVVSLPVYFGMLFEYGNVELRLVDIEDRYYSIAPYVGAETPLGPLFFGSGFTTDGDSTVFMQFGRTF